ncbi:alkaline-phosphatase-like protein [Xylogone sp. PMI_703]|nr:alkaline-phosphatase-like protein [Xylogone sp. PMI_703]
MADHKRNIIQLIADDLGLCLRCYGLKNIQTPNIDNLTAEGTKSTHAFASTASCCGSRSTIYTGLHTHENGQYGLAHGYNHFQTHDHIETVPQIFNTLGYQTGIIESKSRDVTWNVSRAEAFFEKAKETNRAFHLTIGFRDPHRDDSREGFGNDEEDVIAANINVPEYRTEDVEIPSFISDVPELRTELVEYYKSISRMDVGVGLIMQALKKHGLQENTLVIFVSDNGAPFLNSKTTLYDAGVKLPLIVRCPGSPRSIVNPNMVSFLDILPTCLDWAGATDSAVRTANTGKSPPQFGQSFLSILDSSELLPADKWKQHVFGSHTFHEIQNYWPTRFLRIRNVDGPVMIGKRPLEKYLFRGPEELFDLENDPDEVHNLVGEKEYEADLLDCRAKVEAWQYETNDVWLFKDGISAIASQKHQEMGMKLPDRFDLDLESPGNQVGPHWAPTQPRTVSALHTEFG